MNRKDDSSKLNSDFSPDITSPRNETVVAGKAVTLTCEVTGNSGIPHFSWYKEGDSDTVLFNSTGSRAGNKSEYIFTPDSYTFTGDYYCNVTIDYDGESNGPFKSNMSHVIVRGNDRHESLRVLIFC